MARWWSLYGHVAGLLRRRVAAGRDGIRGPTGNDTETGPSRPHPGTRRFEPMPPVVATSDLPHNGHSRYQGPAGEEKSTKTLPTFVRLPIGGR